MTPSATGRSTRGNGQPLLYSNKAISDGRHGRADGILPPETEPMGTISTSRPAPRSTELDAAPTPAFFIGDIPIFPSLDGVDTPPVSDEDGSGTIVGSGIILTNTIAQEQKGEEKCSTNESGEASSSPTADEDWTDGGGKLTPLTDDASQAELKEPQ